MQKINITFFYFLSQVAKMCFIPQKSKGKKNRNAVTLLKQDEN